MMKLNSFNSTTVRRLISSSSIVRCSNSYLKKPLESTDNVCAVYPGQPSPLSHPHKLQPNEVNVGISKEEFAERREKFIRKIVREAERNGLNENSNHLVILPAATTVYSAPDVPYPFRQESNFLYLCGFQEPDSFLVLQSDDDFKCRSTLFVQPKNAKKELWEGPQAGIEGAMSLTGVDHASTTDKLKDRLTQIVTKFDDNDLTIWYNPRFMAQNVSELARDLHVVATVDGRLTFSPYKSVHELRWRKSATEIQLMRKAGEIASSALVETMKFSHPNVDENSLLAKFDFECRIRGASCMAYPPVVAGGNRANTIHYLKADQLVLDKELVLMDAGCEYGGYVSDITRCWPVSGKFTSAQRELYEMLLDVQTKCVNFVGTTRPLTLRDVYRHMSTLMCDGLTKLKIIPQGASETERQMHTEKYCLHHVSHYLGMDVHDTSLISTTIDLEPNVVITVEPGLYFKSDDHSIPEKFRGIGLRIEDDVLITESGCEVLSASCPKRFDEIEAICRKNG